MTIAIQVVGGLLAAGGFVLMMWGVILILKEAYKEGPLWLIGCMAIPIVMAIFVIKHPERVHAGRMTILKGIIPFPLPSRRSRLSRKCPPSTTVPPIRRS